MVCLISKLCYCLEKISHVGASLRLNNIMNIYIYIRSLSLSLTPNGGEGQRGRGWLSEAVTSLL